jgi:hypothetical protein
VLSTAIRAGAAAAIISGAPSTFYALAAGRDPLEATLAAGSLLLPRETRTPPLLAAAAAAHLSLSLGWSAILVRALPRSYTRMSGAAAGLAITAIDLGLARRHYPRIKALPLIPQLADHLAFGFVVGSVVARRRSRAS